MMKVKFEEQKRFRILIMAILLASCCFLTYYFHAVLKSGTVFTHFFYIPIILASVWWKRKGLAVAVFLAVWLILSHFFFRVGGETINDLIRAPMFIAVSLVAAILSEKIAKVGETIRETRDHLEVLVEERTVELRIINEQLKQENAERLSAEQAGKRAEEDLKNRLKELEIFYDATIGREGRIIELKQKVNELLAQLGKEKKYEV
ncbi:MAG: hypothetical protein Q7J15_01595 [Candidatus Desulfaltia sp.]|nr:hypothetical protein [Candidatus Desulfaltia sp.]